MEWTRRTAPVFTLFPQTIHIERGCWLVCTMHITAHTFTIYTYLRLTGTRTSIPWSIVIHCNRNAKYYANLLHWQVFNIIRVNWTCGQQVAWPVLLVGLVFFFFFFFCLRSFLSFEWKYARHSTSQHIEQDYQFSHWSPRFSREFIGFLSKLIIIIDNNYWIRIEK